MAQDNLKTKPTVRTRRWLQFSMRSLLGLMLLCAVVAAVWSLFLMPYRNQLIAINAVKDVGGQMTIASADGPAWQRWLVERVLGKDAFVNVLSLDLRETKADDGVVQRVGDMRQLRELTLDRCKISDAGATVLGGLPALQMLSLRYTGITDVTLRALSGLPALKELQLTGTNVTDKGLDYLRNVTSLEQVYARWTHVTPAGVEALRKTVPQCEVHCHTLVSGP